MVDVEARHRARAIVQRRALGALANDTKWAEFFSRISEAAIPVEIKLIDDEHVFKCGAIWTPVDNYVEGGDGMGPVLCVFVEWVRSNSVEQMQAAAVAVGLEYELNNHVATIFGYR